MKNDNENKNLDLLLNTKRQIEDQLKFLEENVDNLTDSQIDEMMQLSSYLDEILFPEIQELKQELEEKKQDFLNRGHNFDNNL